MPEWKPPTQAEVEGYFERLNNWGRWGDDDQRGTLNLITSEKRAAAVASARSGRVVSLSRDLTPSQRWTTTCSARSDAAIPKPRSICGSGVSRGHRDAHGRPLSCGVSREAV